jgi:hypothetical protein
MRDTVWNGAHFTMQTAQGDQTRPQSVLTERGCWNQCLGVNATCELLCTANDNQRCCLRKILSSHDDFKNQKSWLHEVADMFFEGHASLITEF